MDPAIFLPSAKDSRGGFLLHEPALSGRSFVAFPSGEPRGESIHLHAVLQTRRRPILELHAERQAT
jgi:hypothetical protein